MKELIIKVDGPGERAWDGSLKVFETKELVRCKDCKHGKINICDEFTTCYNVGSCLYGNTRKSNWWCADGEKAVK